MKPQAKEPIKQIVGVGALLVSRHPDEALVTYALGSCLAVTAYDPILMAGGLLHLMLPSSATAPAKAKQMPSMFADTGIPFLFRSLYELGSSKSQLIVKVAGGGKLLDGPDAFDIGNANCEAVKTIFRNAGVVVTAWDVGGTESRTVDLQIATGRLLVRSRGREREL